VTRAPSLLAPILMALALAGCTYVYPVTTLPFQPGFRCFVQVGDAMPLMQVDTGAESSHFYVESAQRLGLRIGKVDGNAVILTDSAGVRRELTDFVLDTSFDFGNLLVRSERVVCLPQPRLPEGASDHDAVDTDGLLGMDVLSHGVWWFDAPRRVLHVVPQERAEQFVVERGRAIVQRVPLLGEPRRPMVRVQFTEQEGAELLLDTGADMTSLPLGSAERLSLESGEELEEQLAMHRAKVRYDELVAAGHEDVTVPIRVRTGRSYGVHGVPGEQHPLLHLPRLQLGSHLARDLVVVEDSQTPALGRDVLGQFDWVLHGPRNELWLLAPR